MCGGGFHGDKYVYGYDIQVQDSWTCSKIGQLLGLGSAAFSPDGSRLVFDAQWEAHHLCTIFAYLLRLSRIKSI